MLHAASRLAKALMAFQYSVHVKFMFSLGSFCFQFSFSLFQSIFNLCSVYVSWCSVCFRLSQSMFSACQFICSLFLQRHVMILLVGIVVSSNGNTHSSSSSNNHSSNGNSNQSVHGAIPPKPPRVLSVVRAT